jgi:hypothetical protein
MVVTLMAVSLLGRDAAAVASSVAVLGSSAALRRLVNRRKVGVND